MMAASGVTMSRVLLAATLGSSVAVMCRCIEVRTVFYNV